MTLPRRFGAGYDHCEDCGSKYAGFHKEDCPKTTNGKKVITIPFKWAHVGVAIYCFVNLGIVPYMMIEFTPIFGFFWLITGFLALGLVGDCDEFIDELEKTFRIIFFPIIWIYKNFPTPSKFGYKVKMKD